MTTPTVINSRVNHIVITVEQHALYAYTNTAEGLLCEPSKVHPTRIPENYINCLRILAVFLLSV